MKKKLSLFLGLALLLLIAFVSVAFAPVFSQSATAIICRFESTACETVWNSNDDVFYRDAGGTETIRVDGQGSMRIAVPTQVGTATPGLVIQQGANGNAIEVRNSAGTPTWYTTGAGAVTQSGAQTVPGLLNANGGIAVDTSAFTVADSTGNTIVSGTLKVTDTAQFVGAATFGTVDGTAADVTFYSDTAGDLMLWDQSEEALTITGTNGQDALNVDDGNVDIADDVDIDGALTFGSDGLYGLGYASANQQVVCGTTVAFTATTEIAPTGMTTPTYVIPIQITAPITTAAFLTASDPTTTTFTLFSWGADYAAGTTGVQAHWCAVGDQ